MSWFRKKSKSEEEPVQETNVEVISDTGEEKKLPEGIKITVEDLFSSPFVCSRNLLSLFESVPEVFFSDRLYCIPYCQCQLPVQESER
ncbi:hypothetical protein R3O61_020295 [Bacteroides hominis]|uniref:hypothetical protein n=1 Tax=Bacteroides hominis TaxID=2763023 RepID=UPI002949367F|nr:hypothetical protein [Bacteroides hominis (ex Liu et al. 2022)]MDV6135639.1 hypothetical protein [Bacteroides hominis (ex Liu et al. 2022)]